MISINSEAIQSYEDILQVRKQALDPLYLGLSRKFILGDNSHVMSKPIF